MAAQSLSVGLDWRPSLSTRHPLTPAPSRVHVQPIRIHQSAWPASPTVRGPSTVIIQGHPIQPEPFTRSHASSNLNFNFTYHASGHPILPGHSWRPTVSSSPPSTGSRHPSASPAPPKVCGPSGVIIPAHRIQPEPPTRSQASSNLNFKFTYHPSESATQSILLSIIHQPGPRFAHPSLDPKPVVIHSSGPRCRGSAAHPDSSYPAIKMQLEPQASSNLNFTHQFDQSIIHRSAPLFTHRSDVD